MLNTILLLVSSFNSREYRGSNILIFITSNRNLQLYYMRLRLSQRKRLPFISKDDAINLEMKFSIIQTILEFKHIIK